MEKQTSLVVIGASSGGLKAVLKIIQGIRQGFSIPLALVLHQPKGSSDRLLEILQTSSGLTVKEPYDKEKIEKSILYVAPPDYHLMVEEDFTFSYSYSETVNYSRPSIDVLFETAACAVGENLAGVLLTGASMDGAKGLKAIADHNGITIAENPATAEMPVMPRSAIKLVQPTYIAKLEKISYLLNQLNYGIKTASGYH